MVPTVSYFGSFFTSLDVWCVHRLYSSHQERRASSVLHSHRFIFVFFFFSFCSTSCRCFGVGRESRREFARQANDTVVRAGSIVHVQRRVSYYGSHQLVVRVGWNLLHVDIICGGGRCTGGWCLDSNSNSTVITMGRPCLDPGTQKPHCRPCVENHRSGRRGILSLGVQGLEEQPRSNGRTDKTHQPGPPRLWIPLHSRKQGYSFVRTRGSGSWACRRGWSSSSRPNERWYIASPHCSIPFSTVFAPTGIPRRHVIFSPPPLAVILGKLCYTGVRCLRCRCEAWLRRTITVGSQWYATSTRNARPKPY